mmetsp:Transcript_36428/g.47797  ORF Transcript_36428/g.47797 Transcript_36428/m.47797 type:complete len:116 (+) Transcript_36428:600-947(+)
MDTSKTDKSPADIHNSGNQATAVQSMASLFEEKVEEEKPPHPFDSVFGPKINTQIQAQAGSTIGLTYSQFKEISWPNVFPNFICDLVEILTGFSMTQELQDRAGRKFDEDKTLRI